MKRNDSRGVIAAALLMWVAAVFQVVSLARYMSRLPDDALGIWLHIAAIVLFAVAGTTLFVTGRVRQDKAD